MTCCKKEHQVGFYPSLLTVSGRPLKGRNKVLQISSKTNDFLTLFTFKKLIILLINRDMSEFQVRTQHDNVARRYRWQLSVLSERKQTQGLDRRGPFLRDTLLRIHDVDSPELIPSSVISIIESVGSMDLKPLMPRHFLEGEPLISPFEINLSDFCLKINRLDRWEINPAFCFENGGSNTWPISKTASNGKLRT